jgi:hypothetical protein
LTVGIYAVGYGFITGSPYVSCLVDVRFDLHRC